MSVSGTVQCSYCGEHGHNMKSHFTGKGKFVFNYRPKVSRRYKDVHEYKMRIGKKVLRKQKEGRY